MWLSRPLLLVINGFERNLVLNIHIILRRTRIFKPVLGKAWNWSEHLRGWIQLLFHF